MRTFAILNMKGGVGKTTTASALLAYSLSALNFAKALLRSTFGPPLPKRLEGRMPPAEEEHADGA